MPPTSLDLYPPQSSKNGKRLDGVPQAINRMGLAEPLCVPHRRVASKSKSREGSQSCSPFGKKKKCKDKYLAKHSSSESDPAPTLLACSPYLRQINSLLSQFLTSSMSFLTRRSFDSPLSKGKHWFLLVRSSTRLQCFIRTAKCYIRIFNVDKTDRVKVESSGSSSS